MNAPSGKILESEDEIRQLLKNTQRIAVLGITTEERADRPAFYVPEYLASVGFQIVPVPVYYPEATQILGQKVYRKLEEIPGEIDLVQLFRRTQSLPAHLDDILAKKPKAVWMQSGIRHDEVAEKLAHAGIQVVQDRCLMEEHQHLFS